MHPEPREAVHPGDRRGHGPGQKELIAIADGYRESEQSWLEVLLDLSAARP